MAIVLPHGVLFRSGAEGHIRRYLIEDKNYLDAVIGLPESIFYGTPIPTCILVFKKCREHPKDILFIDSSQYFEKGKNQNKLRDSDIEKIITTYKNRTNEAKYSHKASIQEIAENDFNLNIPRYVDSFEAEDEVNLDAVSKRLKELEIEIKQTDATIADFCQQLGIETPF